MYGRELEVGVPHELRRFHLGSPHGARKQRAACRGDESCIRRLVTRVSRYSYLPPTKRSTRMGAFHSTYLGTYLTNIHSRDLGEVIPPSRFSLLF